MTGQFQPAMNTASAASAVSQPSSAAPKSAQAAASDPAGAKAVRLVHPDHPKGHEVKLKVFWKTTRPWTAADISDYQQNVKTIAEGLRTGKRVGSSGKPDAYKFTCEDFAIRVICEYAESKGLPLKLTTGVRTYRNMENFSEKDNAKYSSDMVGFSEMIMVSYGAPDMQRTGANTVQVASPDDLMPSDILAEAHDMKGAATFGTAHHIQLVIEKTADKISIDQGNSSNDIHQPFTFFHSLGRRLGISDDNAADPQSSLYAGKPVEQGNFSSKGDGIWDYNNVTTGHGEKDFMKVFDLYRWNFMEFNK